MCSNQSFRPAPKEEDRPHTAEELRVMKEKLDTQREMVENLIDKETQILKEILKAQEKIRKDIDHKRAQKLAAAAMEDEAWVFEKAANGWI
jgi:hypothetical protein